MAMLSTTLVDRFSAPELAPTRHAIDLAHLARMTFGEASLEREVLQLFERQATMLMARMAEAAPAVAAAAAHTISGSAQGIGAFRVAQAAAMVERTAADGSHLEGALGVLAAAVAEAQTEIADLLQAC